MATLRNISHSPSDKRGLGLTFLGMMNKDDTSYPIASYDFINRVEFENAIQLMRAELQVLRVIVNTPWYKKAWAAIVRLFKGDSK
jgi:hypothetical protein